MTTLIDIYEACGGTVSEDRTQVSVDGPYKPFDIILRVIPTGFDTGFEGEKVTFSILLDPKMTFDPTPTGVVYRETLYDESVTLPVELVRILKEE